MKLTLPFEATGGPVYVAALEEVEVEVCVLVFEVVLVEVFEVVEVS